MIFDYAIKVTDIAIVFATIAGPILAIQAQKMLENHRAIRERRNSIFRTLMATRAAMLSVAHVEALNAIPVDFYGENNNLREINETWKLYLDHHTLNVTTSDVWMEKRLSLFHDILHLISVYLGYRFTRSQIARDIYSPQAHSDLENEQTIIRRGLVKLFNMEISLPMAVTEFPATADDESLANQRDIQKAILEVLEGRRPLPVTNVPDAIG